MLQIDKSFREPSRCSCGRKGGFKLLSKDMVDAQRIGLEESADTIDGASQPRRMNVFLKEDLVDPYMEERTTPGARVRVIGVLKEVPIPLKTGAISTRFDIAIEANNIVPLEETFNDLKITEEDERQILELAADPQLYSKLRDSMAPSVYGHDEIKEALILQLFGGVRRMKSDGTFSRGDIHMLLMGDPGVAKSIGKDERIMYISDKETGYDTIENLYKKFKGSPKDLKVLTIDMKKHEPMWEQVNEIIKHLPEKDLIKISTEHGKSIIATKDHSFITLSENGEIVPIKGEELTKETYVPIPINYHKKEFEYFLPGHFNKRNTNSKILPERIRLDRDFGFFMGIFLAEGYIKKKNAIEISNKNREIQKRVINFSKKINLNYNVNKQSITLFSKDLSDILMACSYDSEDLKKIKRGIKGNFSRIKKIPDFAYFSPKEFIYGLISGLFSGDGRLIKDKKMLKGFELITVSKSLAEGTSDLLFSVGILNKVKRRAYTYQNNKTDYYSLSIPTPMIEKFSEDMQILGRTIKFNKNKPIYSYNNLIPCGNLVYEVVRKLGYNRRIDGDRTLAAEMRTVKRRKTIGRLRLINLIKEFEKRSKGNNLPELDLLKKIVKSDIIWSKIKDIEHLKKKNEEVYDLFIPSTNTFVSNGIGVHNSVLLKFIARIAPKGRYISGKSATAAGITATVVKDEFMRGWSLEAGAIVLANKGICAIDELEDMAEEDRSALHEALEQQTVTISKANVHATLNSQTSVLAAANPKFGRFDLYQPIAQQINIDVALLNRFDLLFVLKDLPEKNRDDAIAMHVLSGRSRKEFKQPIEEDLLRKYLAYAKQRIAPDLTDKAIEEIRDFYVDLRNRPTVSDDLVKPIPITARQLEALIRMSEANAKARLSSKVTKEDAKKAIELMKYCLMQVGFDYETKQIDIDRISTGVTAHQKNKIILVREAINRLESRLGKLIPIEEISKELSEKVETDVVEEIIDKLAIAGDIFKPKRGFIQRM